MKIKYKHQNQKTATRNIFYIIIVLLIFASFFVYISSITFFNALITYKDFKTEYEFSNHSKITTGKIIDYKWVDMPKGNSKSGCSLYGQYNYKGCSGYRPIIEYFVDDDIYHYISTESGPISNNENLIGYPIKIEFISKEPHLARISEWHKNTLFGDVLSLCIFILFSLLLGFISAILFCAILDTPK